LIVGSLGFVAAGTLFSAITVRSTMGATLLPVLLFPLLVPVLLFGATATARSLAGTTAGVGGELRLLTAYALVTLVLGSFLFSSVVDDA
jgi:heme exporter protein B